MGIENPAEAATKTPDYTLFTDINEVVKEMQTMSIYSCFLNKQSKLKLDSFNGINWGGTRRQRQFMSAHQNQPMNLTLNDEWFLLKAISSYIAWCLSQ